VWVANRGDGTVTRLSAVTGRRQGDPIHAGEAPSALAVVCDAVLVLDTNRRRVLRIDPRQGSGVREVATIRGFPSALAVGAGAAWVVDARSGTVTRLSGQTP
jgi:streptogramin lyase